MYIVDFAILLGQVTLHPVNKILYGIILIIVYTIILDKVMILGSTRTELKIVSKKHKEITEAILKHGDRGVTLMDCEGGYLHEQTQLVYSVISNRELPKIERLIHTIDPECFMVVTRVNEVKGYGFTLPKAHM
ncbi:MAG: YitT family protein, partial [Lachnospiraceae bacterium]|nr:YitT family protein [Lachnospiraceae bacterium]